MLGCSLIDFFLVERSPQCGPNKDCGDFLAPWNGGVGVTVGVVSCIPKGYSRPRFSVLVTASIVAASEELSTSMQGPVDAG